MSKEDLSAYMADRSEYLQDLTTVLREEVHTHNPEEMKSHLCVIITHRPTISTMLAKLEKFLDEALHENLTNKEKGETELDRKITMDSRVSEYRYYRNVVEGLLKSIDVQASAMQSLLSFEKKYLTHLEHVQ